MKTMSKMFLRKNVIIKCKTNCLHYSPKVQCHTVNMAQDSIHVTQGSHKLAGNSFGRSLIYIRGATSSIQRIVFQCS